MSMTKDRKKESTKVRLALGTLMFCFSGAFFEGWLELTGIQESLWTASGLFFAIAGGCVLIAAALGLVVYLSLKQQIAEKLTRFLFGALVLSGMLWAVLLVVFLNVKLDTSEAEPVELVVRDRFVVTVESRTSSQTYQHYYLGLSVPEGLRNYALVVLPDNTFGNHAVGQRFWVDGHRGLFHLPWYRFRSHFRWGKNQELATIGKKFIIRSVRGTFSGDSPHRKDLAGRGIPLSEE
jgi:hypothetical protein